MERRGEESDVNDDGGNGGVDDENVPCPDCELEYRSELILARHWLHSHFRKPPIPCPVEGCDTQLAQLERTANVRQHILTAHSTDDLQLLNHLKKNRKKGNSKWEMCFYHGCETKLPISNLVLRYRHFKYDHDHDSSRVPILEGTFKLPFPNCDAALTRRYQLKDHLERIHKADPSKFIGETRGRGAPGKREKGFKCPFPGCDMETTRMVNLCLHSRSAHGVDPREMMQLEETESPLLKKKRRGEAFRCPFSYCKAILSRRVHWRNHIRKVHKENPEEYIGELENWLKNTQKGGTSKKRKVEVDENMEEEEEEEVEYREEDFELEGEVLLCMLCCFSFYRDQGESRENSLLNNRQFDKFVREVFLVEEREVKSSADLLRHHKHISVCSDCRNLISAVVTKMEAMEEHSMEDGSGPSDLTEIGRRRDEYAEEMRRIGNSVSGGDVSCLEAHLEEFERVNGNESLVRRFRDGIVSLTEKLEEPRQDGADDWGRVEGEGKWEIVNEVDIDESSHFESEMEDPLSLYEECDKTFDQGAHIRVRPLHTLVDLNEDDSD